MGQATRAKTSLASRQGEENGISTWSKPCFSLKKVGGTAVGDWDMYIYIYTQNILLLVSLLIKLCTYIYIYRER